MLLSWNLIYKHNFSPNRCFIWNNKHILYKSKTLFFENWFSNNIVLVSQLFNQEGLLLTYSEFLSKFKIPITPKEYAVVMDAVPSGLKMLCKNTCPQSSIQSLDLVDTAVGRVCFLSSVKHNNRQVCALFQKDVVFRPPIVTFWNSRVDGLIWHNIWKLPHKYLITNKVKYISFKLIYKYYPSNYFLVNRFNCDIDTLCTFCGLHTEIMYYKLCK